MYPYSYDYGMYHNMTHMYSGQWTSWLISFVILAPALWFLFLKARENGWAAVIPGYRLYVLFKITWGSGLMCLLLLIPLANFVIWIITMVKLSKAYGRGGGWACGLVFLLPIFLYIMAFSKDFEYVGVPKKTADYSYGNGQQGYQNPYSQGYEQQGNDEPSHQQDNYRQQSPQNNQYYYQQQEAASPGQVKYCPDCGARLENNEKYCPKCGKAQI